MYSQGDPLVAMPMRASRNDGPVGIVSGSFCCVVDCANCENLEECWTRCRLVKALVVISGMEIRSVANVPIDILLLFIVRYRPVPVGMLWISDIFKRSPIDPSILIDRRRR